MKYLRLTSTPEPDRAPRLFHLFARAPYVTETRLCNWNLADEGSATVLFEIDGNLDRFRADLDDVSGILEADINRITDGRFYLLVRVRISQIPLLRTVFPVLTRAGTVVVKPVVYRDGQVHARIVGTASELQSMVAELPPSIDVEIHAVGEYDVDRESPSSKLSERQREAVLTALELGYYDQPRKATHEDVGERLGCAPNTASEHLQKGEAKLLKTVLRSESKRSQNSTQ
ncbi:helix-turn-helix domain-containing protein [Haladaptatus sp. NG-SE-30]